MLSLSVLGDDVKPLMNMLLKDSVFDPFLVRDIDITNFTRIQISGFLENEPLPDAPKSENYANWAQIRPLAFAMIKGNVKPKRIKLVFSPDKPLRESIHPDASAMFLNMLYENNQIHFTTATAQKTFSLQNDIDVVWEEYVRQFFQQHAIPFLPQDG